MFRYGALFLWEAWLITIDEKVQQLFELCKNGIAKSTDFDALFAVNLKKYSIFNKFLIFFIVNSIFLLILQRPAMLCHLILYNIRWSGNGRAHTYKGVTALWF